MIKQVLIVLLGVFFLINGINHFYNSHILKEYVHKRGFIAPKLMVIVSGVFLIIGGLSLITGIWIIEGIIGLCIFLVIASFSLHRFWEEKGREMMMMEFMHFIKNWAILFELVYIASSLTSD